MLRVSWGPSTPRPDTPKRGAKKESGRSGWDDKSELLEVRLQA